ncbi:MAG: hypothetical protein IKQ91_01030 [Oscillospiraceae bacterium]|nr:hypothetical protein [Oscillospiraceae bacterium]
MKIEPRKTAKLPKYAAALAAIASAAVLTGCRTAGEVATDGTAPDPNAGANIIEQTLPPDDSSEDDGELVLDGEISNDSLPDESSTETECTGTECTGEDDEIMLEGDVAVLPDESSEPEYTRSPELAGKVAVRTDYPDIDTVLATPGFVSTPQLDAMTGEKKPVFRQLYDKVRALPDAHIQVYADAFTKAGLSMNRSESWFIFEKNEFKVALETADGNTMLIFYDGRQQDNGITMSDWIKQFFMKEFDWGGYEDDITGESRWIYVDLSAEPADGDLAAYAEKIAKDVIG